MNNTKKLLRLITFIFSFSVLACQSPLMNQSKSVRDISLALRYSAPGVKTVIPNFIDIENLIDSYEVILISQDGFSERTSTYSVQSTLTIPSIPCGTWNITVNAKKDSTLVAQGKAGSITVTTSSSSPVNIAMKPVSPNGTLGKIDLSMNIFKDVSAVEFILKNSSGNIVNTKDAILIDAGDNWSSSYVCNDLPSGIYTLYMTFKNVDAVMAVLDESINVWGGLVSNSWVSPSGSLDTLITFSSDKLLNSSSDLLTLTVDCAAPGALAFNSLFSTYDLGTAIRPTGGMISFTIGQENIGQKVSFQWNGETTERLIGNSEKSPALPLVVGKNTLLVKVISANRIKAKTYIITMDWVPTYKSKIGIEMTNIPEGSFSRDGTTENISYVSAFSIGTFPVTRAQYQQVMGAAFDPSDTAYSNGLNDPVQRLSFYHAIAFCNKLSLLEGLTPVYKVKVLGTFINFSTLNNSAIPSVENADWNAASADLSANGYRLPTEAEWQWAAMGANKDKRTNAIVNNINMTGYSKAYAGSAEDSSSLLNIDAYAFHSLNANLKTNPVGLKLPNELGLYDMTGNVWNWCWDLCPADMENSPNPLLGVTRNSIGPIEGAEHIIRGGSFTKDLETNANDFSLNLGRHSEASTSPLNFADVGFRLVRSSYENICTSVKAVSAGENHTLVLMQDGTLYAMGGNANGQLGDGTKVNRNYPVPVINGKQVRAVFAGFQSSMFIKEDGSLWVFGRNNFGQLGIGSSTDISIPRPVLGLTNVKLVSLSLNHSVVLKNDKTVWVMGEGARGALGLGSVSNQTSPVRLGTYANIESIATGWMHTMLLLSDGNVLATGDNSNGQYGNAATSSNNTPVSAATNLTASVKALNCGWTFSYFIKNDNSLLACGQDDDGQLGDGYSGSGRKVTTPIQIATNVKAVWGGRYFGAFQKLDGSVFVMGWNPDGQFGNGTTTSSLVPVRVLPLCNNIATISNGNNFMFILKTDGSLWGTGNNTNGNLGIGSLANQNNPKQVYF